MMLQLSRAFALLAIAVFFGGKACAEAYKIPTHDPQVPTIDGYLSLPPGSGPFPVVVLFHGLKTFSTYAPTFAVLTDHYNRMGIATFAVDWGTARHLQNGGP